MRDVISKKGITEHLKNDFLPIYVLDTIDSTNAYAKALTEDYALVVADFQSSGRGRLNRTFHSPKGTGIYMSLKIKVSDLYQNVPFITTLASVGVHKAIKELYNTDCGIKWVNDLYIGTKKVSGILCEVADSTHAVIGVGINVYPSPFPKELTDIATYLTEDFTITRNRLISCIADNIISLSQSLPDTSFMEYYKSHSIVLGKDILCIQGDNTFPATAVDITSEGALVVKKNNSYLTLSTGEISIRFKD